MAAVNTNEVTKTKHTETTKTTRMEARTNDHHHAHQHPPQRKVVSGRAKMILDKYQERVKELTHLSLFKPDMKAYKQMKNTIGIDRVHGSFMEDEIPIGVILEGRGEAAILGIHCLISQGIDGIKDEPCFAVCISGGYADDENHTHTADGTIVYTGAGGQDKKKRQVKDQKQNKENKSLILSYETGTPIRVLSGTFGKYTYNGVYKCISYTYEESVDGPMVYKFTLQAIPGKSIPVSMPLLVSPKGRAGARKRSGGAGAKDRFTKAKRRKVSGDELKRAGAEIEALPKQSRRGHDCKNRTKYRVDNNINQRKLAGDELYSRKSSTMVDKESNRKQNAKLKQFRRESNVENINKNIKIHKPHVNDENRHQPSKVVALKDVANVPATRNDNNNNNQPPAQKKNRLPPRKPLPSVSTYFQK